MYSFITFFHPPVNPFSLTYHFTTNDVFGYNLSLHFTLLTSPKALVRENAT